MTPGLCSMTPAWGPLAGPRSLKEWGCVKRGIGRLALFEPRARRAGRDSSRMLVLAPALRV